MFEVGNANRWRRRIGWLACGLLAVTGCANLRLPAIDPTGERIFLPPPNFTTLNTPGRDPVTGERRFPLRERFRSQPAYQSPPSVPDCQTPALLPNGQRPPQLDPLSADPVAPRIVIPGICQNPARAAATANTGCWGQSRTPSHPLATVALAPRQQIATVGSEVVLIGGVCGGKGFYRIREPVEWLIAQGSVGHFIEPGQPFVGRIGLRGRLSRWFSEPLPQLLSNNYAYGCTSCKPQVLTRGTVVTTDDLIVESGQAWIGVTSPVEGSTYITLVAPDLDGWDQRTQTAVVHWVDGQWTLPPSAILRGNQPHTLTTSVVRRITSVPVAGWTVRYQILDPTATFSDGSTMIEVVTDSTGQASVQIVPIVADGATARVHTQILRPARGGEPDRLLIAEGTSTITWTNAQLGVRIDGPSAVELNRAATYAIELVNPGAQAAQNVAIRAMIPAGMEYVASSPPAQVFGSRLDWNVDLLPPGARQAFQVEYRATQSGTIQHCVSAQASGGTPVEDCLTTTVAIDALFIDMIGPDDQGAPVMVGEEVEYRITIVNRGDRTLSNVVLNDRFDPGLEHREGPSPVEWSLGALEPGQSREVGLTFRVVAEGRQCHILEASAEGVPTAQAGACLVGAAPRRSEFTVTKNGPPDLTVGAQGDFFIIVENTGEETLLNLQVLDQYDPELQPVAAEPTDNRYDGDRVVWYISRLEPGEKRTFQVTCEALRDVPQACTRAVVTTAAGAQQADEVCLPVLPQADPPLEDDEFDSDLNNSGPNRFPLDSETGPFPRGATPLPGGGFDAEDPNDDNGFTSDTESSPAQPLELVFESRGDRWRVGDTIEFLAVIRNLDPEPDRDVELTVQLPEQLELVNYGPIRATNPQTRNWRVLRMTPIRSLRGGETIEQRIVTRVIAAGQFVARANVRSLRFPAGISRENTGVASP